MEVYKQIVSVREEVIKEYLQTAIPIWMQKTVKRVIINQ